jgi:hypothetical protein
VFPQSLVAGTSGFLRPAHPIAEGIVAMEQNQHRRRYRCKPGTNIWHLDTACPDWPRIDYWSQATRPADAQSCPTCADKHTR